MPKLRKAQMGEIIPGGFVGGTKLFQQRACQALPLLVRQARAAQPIFYSALAREMGMPNARNLNHVLGAIGRELQNLSDRWERDVPPIQCLVINKSTRMPGEGIAWFVPDPEDFRKRPPLAQRETINLMLASVYRFSHWDAVLSEFGLMPASPAIASLPGSLPLPRKEWRGSNDGEGEDHRRLKEFVASHPEAIGLTPGLGIGETEYEFHSADTIDVIFKANNQWVGVEVKGTQSDDGDIVRGMFQCVKYNALIEAEQKSSQTTVASRVLLVLGRDLPPGLVALQNVLGIEIIPNMQTPTGPATRA